MRKAASTTASSRCYGCRSSKRVSSCKRLGAREALIASFDERARLPKTIRIATTADLQFHRSSSRDRSGSNRAVWAIANLGHSLVTRRVPEEDLKMPGSWTAPNDPLGVFCRQNHTALKGSGTGPLAGLTFAVKDAFHIAGVRTGFGQPDWLRTHEAPRDTAAAVRMLLDAGADMLGKTHCDELCYSLTGENVHYGTPVNVNAPGRVPGGSSNGSAAAVAGGLVDFALGTDCGGSVRIPASYCGIIGLRPTHRRVSDRGALPFGPSFDVVGWFSRDPQVFVDVGNVLLDEDRASPPQRLLMAEDAWALLEAPVTDALAPAAEKAKAVLGNSANVRISPEGLADWFEVFRTLQAAEIWATLG